MKGIDDESRKLYWWNRNYFFAGTVCVVLINLIVQACGSDLNWFHMLMIENSSWNSVLSFKNLWLNFVSAFMHLSWQHTLLNMICFLICGAWLERRKGTFPLLGLVVLMAFVTENVVSGNSLSLTSFGYSAVNYGFYAYAMIDYIVLLCKKETRTKLNVISGAILMGFIYFAACFSGGTSAVSFEWYPNDFMHNMGHYSGFLAGAFLGLAVQCAKFIAKRE